MENFIHALNEQKCIIGNVHSERSGRPITSRGLLLVYVVVITQVYAIAARSSPKESQETKTYFKKAIDSASKNQSLQSRYLLEYAEWVVNNGNISEAVHSVQLAIDKLMSRKISTLPIRDLHTLGRAFLFLHLHAQSSQSSPDFLLLSHHFYLRILTNTLKTQAGFKPEDWIYFEASFFLIM